MEPVTLEMLLNTDGEFSWGWNSRFFIETSYGNYVWSDPSYPGGDNSIIRFNGGLKQFLRIENIPYVRSKGRHVLKNYMPEGVVQIGKL